MNPIFLVAGIGASEFFAALVVLVIILVIVIGVFLLMRELVMWYWKINAIVGNQQRQIQILNDILQELRSRPK